MRARDVHLICDYHSYVVGVCKATKQGRNAEEHASTVYISWRIRLVPNITEQVGNGVDDEQAQGKPLGLPQDDFNSLESIKQVFSIFKVPFPINAVWCCLEGTAATLLCDSYHNPSSSGDITIGNYLADMIARSLFIDGSPSVYMYLAKQRNAWPKQKLL